jgi:acetyl-CoA carboxylase carboxyltransferase component
MSVEDRIQQMQDLKAAIRQGGGATRVAKQHESGKLTARERIEKPKNKNIIRPIQSTCANGSSVSRPCNFGV